MVFPARWWSISWLLLLLVPPFAQAGEGFLSFLERRKARHWIATPKKVLAFYYTWYGTPERHGRWVHWKEVDPDGREIANSTDFPARGAYDSHDPELIDHHIDLATRCGVDGFICTWWGRGTFDDLALEKVLERAKAKGFLVSVYWETAPGRGDAKIRHAVEDLTYILEKYGSHPAFLKVEGNPVIFVYGRVMGQVSWREWREIIRLAGESYGKEFLLVADGYGLGNARIFDGVHTYNICGWVQGKSGAALKSASREAFSKAVRLAVEAMKISCLTVIPGYDDTKIRSPGIRAERKGGETYRTLWREAIEADPDWVLITSWNEWHEGSEIEPSFEHGDRYLEITREYARKFKKTPSGRIVAEGKPSGELERLFKEKRPVVLPDFAGDAVFRLLDAGLPLRDLTWDEVLDPSLFNPEDCPVAIYAGFEGYTRTVREEGDVDAALIRYLEEGGFLISLAAGPYPFFYDERGGAVSSARKLGFPLQQGWERPPSGEELSFDLDTGILKGLPSTVPFPGQGDLRWRPCDENLLREGDVYVPLARLKDGGGGSRGDGIAYIEHVKSPPRGGRNLYVWMRMADTADGDVLFRALMRFAAGRATEQEQEEPF